MDAVKRLKAWGNLAARTSAAPAFSPLSLSPLVWLKAGTSTIWQDSARTTPAVADADPVGAWDDLSGNNNHVLQATAGKRPSLKLAIKNGLPVIRFDGVDDFLAVASNAGLNPTSITIAVVAEATSYANTPLYVMKNTSYNFYSGPTGTIGSDLPNSLVSGAGSVVTGTYYLLELTADATSMFIYKNGVQAATRGSTAGLASSANALGIGARGDGIEPLAGDICEVVIVGSVLSAGNRASLETYLLTTWGLP